MNDHFNSSGPDAGDKPLSSANATSPDIDVSAYLSDLDGLDLDGAAKFELLTILHDIMSHFVQMGFDLKDVDVCGQLFGDFTDAASGGLDGVESSAFTARETPDAKTDEDSR
jgi:hypothetical protein